METKSGRIRSVEKALALLDVLLFDDIGGQGRSVSELAQGQGFPVNTTHNLLKTMVGCGYVGRTADGRYVGGSKARQIGRRNRGLNPEVGEAIERVMTDLANELQEAVVMTTLINGRRLVISRMRSQHPIQVDARFEDHLYSTPTGRVLLAFSEESERSAAVVHEGLPGEVWDGLETREDLEAACAKIRKQGGVHIQSANGDIISFARPVFDGRGRFVGALGTYAPTFRTPGPRRKAMEKALMAAAKAISDFL